MLFGVNISEQEIIGLVKDVIKNIHHLLLLYTVHIFGQEVIGVSGIAPKTQWLFAMAATAI